MTREDHLIKGIDVGLEVWRFGGLMLFWGCGAAIEANSMDELLGFCALLVGNKLHYYSMKHCMASFLGLPLRFSTLKFEVLGVDTVHLVPP
jgi:hypothetical protein